MCIIAVSVVKRCRAVVIQAVRSVKKTHTCDSKKGCKDKGCTAIIYKLDLMKHTTELTTSALVVDLLCEHFCYLLTPTYADKSVEYDSLTSPPPLCSRQKLALYSTYII